MSQCYNKIKEMLTFCRSAFKAVSSPRSFMTANTVSIKAGQRNQNCVESHLALENGSIGLFSVTVKMFPLPVYLVVRKLHYTSSCAGKCNSSAKPTKHMPATQLKVTKGQAAETQIDKKKAARKDSKKMASNQHKVMVRESVPAAAQFCTNAQVALETNEDITAFAADVINRAKTVDVMVSSVPQHQVEGLIIGLHHLGFKPSDILQLLSTFPVFLLHHRHLFPNIHLLMLHGLDLEQVREVMVTFPGLLNVKEGQINDIADALRGGNFREKSLAKVIARNPSIFLLDKASLNHRLTKLRELFKSSDVITVVVNSPDVLTREWADIQALFDYVFHDMQVTQKQMVYASLFSHSLQHVKCRHAFLVRAGLFNTSKRKDGEKSPNVRLDQIIDTSDEAFCARLGQFDVRDYRTFCSLYKKERHEQKNESDSDEE